MSIVADLKAIKKVFEAVEALESGEVKVEVSGALTVTVTGADGKVILDTTVEIDT